MHDGYSKVGIPDNGGRRSGDDRRKVPVPGFLPERRTWQDRRGDQDRRSRFEEEKVDFLRRNTDRYLEFANTQKGLLYGFLLSLPLWGLILVMFYLTSSAKF